MTNRTRRPVTARRRLTGLTAALVAVCAVTATMLPAAGAAPAPDKKKQAAELQDQIEASDLQISGLAERLHAAEAKRDESQQTAADAQDQIQKAEAEVGRISGLVGQNLASLYRRTLRGGSVADIDFGDANDLIKRGQYSQAQASKDDDLLQQLNVAQADLAVTRTEAEHARDAAAAESQDISNAKSAIEAARAAQQGLLDKVTGELAAAVAAEKAKRESATKSKFAGGPVSYPNVGPPNGSASQAIAFARAVIGSGYSTNPRMGPTYDCSGLVFSAWGAAGVSIPSTSAGMFGSLPHVPLESVQPGDLIFWGAGGGEHVALYVGGGSIIDASSGSNSVVQRGIWGSPSGAARVV